MPVLLPSRALAAPLPPPSGITPIFSFANFVGASSQVLARWEAAYNGAVIDATKNVAQHQAGGIWYVTAQPISQFTTNFTFQQTAASAPNTQGLCFVVQNCTAPGASGNNSAGDANLCGYGAFSGQAIVNNSIAIKFDLSGANGQNKYPAGISPQTTGLMINGGPFGGMVPDDDLNPTAINLYLGNLMAVTVTYDGTTLTWVIQDTVTGAQARFSRVVDIPSIVGASTAFVGFTGGNVTPVAAQSINSWTYASGINPRLAPPSFSVAPGQYASTQSVSLSGSGSIYYTTNGLPPTSSDTLYTGTPISISASTILQAVAIQTNATDSFVAVGNYQIATGGTPLINFPSGFTGAAGLVIAVGSAVRASTLKLTDSAAQLEAGAAWYAAPVPVSSFTANFQIQVSNGAGITKNGLAYVIQNAPPASMDLSILDATGGPFTIGVNGGSSMGYSGSTNGSLGQISGIPYSVCLKFDVNNNTVGVFTNGAQPTGGTPLSGSVNLSNGHPFDVALTYSGTTLGFTITDHTVPADTFSTNFTIDIPGTVGNTAYIGFTAGTGFASGSNLTSTQQVNSWTQ